MKLSGPPCAFIRPGREAKLQFTGNSSDFAEIHRLQKHTHHDLIWFRDGEKTYTIEDPAYMARIAGPKARLENLEKREIQLNRQLVAESAHLGEAGAEIGIQVAQMVTGLNGQVGEQVNKELMPLVGQITSYGAQIGALAARMAAPGLSEAEQDALQKQIDELQAKMDVLEKQIDAVGERIEASAGKLEKQAEHREKQGRGVEDTGKRMEAAAKVVEALSKQIEEAQKEQEKLSPVLLKAIQELIPEARAKGKARPVESPQK